MTANLHIALLSSVPTFGTALIAVVDQGNVMQPADTKVHHLIVKDLPLDSECSAIAAQHGVQPTRPAAPVERHF
jgi:hypothetical protein